MPKPKTEKAKAAAKARKAEKRAKKRAEEKSLEPAETLVDTVAKQKAGQLAQIINLRIAGYSSEEIGQAIGATAEEVDRRIMQDSARFVRTQPALRAYVRDWISGKFTEMIEADWDKAKDPDSPARLENQDRVIRMLDRLAKLHGADAPSQAEVKIEAAPEAVQTMVSALAAQRGYGFDTGIFDVVDAEVVEDAVEESREALERASAEVDEGEDEDL